MSCYERRIIGFRASIISANWLGGSPPARQVSARPSPFPVQRNLLGGLKINVRQLRQTA